LDVEGKSLLEQTVKKSIFKKQTWGLEEVCNKILMEEMREDSKKYFLYPVNTRELVDYLDVIDTPMDFTTIKSKLNRYGSIEEFQRDVYLVFENAKKYNDPITPYHREADRLLQCNATLFEEVYKLEITAPLEEKKVTTVKSIPLKFHINKIPSLVKRVSESIKEMSALDCETFGSTCISDLLKDVSFPVRRSVNPSGPLLSKLRDGNMYTDFVKFLNVDTVNGEILKDIENCKGDLDNDLEIRDWIE
jgi:hypothetical protein